MYTRFYLMSDEMCCVLVFGMDNVKLFKIEIVISYQNEFHYTPFMWWKKGNRYVLI